MQTDNAHPSGARRCAFPCGTLFPFVDRYWSWEGPRSRIPALPELLPGTGKELIFHYADPFLVRGQSGGTRHTPQAHILCVRRNIVKLAPGGETGFFAIRFRAGAFRHFSPVPLAEIAALQDPLPDASLFLGKDARELRSAMSGSSSFSQRVVLAETWLLRRLRKRSQRDAAIDKASSLLYYAPDHARPSRVAAAIGLGPRQFQREFKAAMNMSPKAFLRLVRLQRVIRSILLANGSNILDAAIAEGYYDQPHFIREFKEFTNETPAAFFHNGRGLTHFYNTSRPENRMLVCANTA